MYPGENKFARYTKNLNREINLNKKYSERSEIFKSKN